MTPAWPQPRASHARCPRKESTRPAEQQRGANTRDSFSTQLVARARTVLPPWLPPRTRAWLGKALAKPRSAQPAAERRLLDLQCTPGTRGRWRLSALLKAGVTFTTTRRGRGGLASGIRWISCGRSFQDPPFGPTERRSWKWRLPYTRHCIQALEAKLGRARVEEIIRNFVDQYYAL